MGKEGGMREGRREKREGEREFYARKLHLACVTY